MLSRQIQRNTAKIVAYVMLLSNSMPAFAAGELYRLSISRHERLDGPSRYQVELLKKVTLESESTFKYNKVFSQFVDQLNIDNDSQVRIDEIVQNLSCDIMNEAQEHLEQMTQLSWGHSVDIPGLGQVILSHDGNVLFNPLETCNSSIHIEVPSMLLLNSAKYTDIDVEATAAFLINSKATLDNLTFHGNGHDGLKNGLFIDDKSTLQVQNLTLENALLLNAGELNVGQELNFNGGSCFNAGNLISTAPNSSFKNAAYFFNSKKGKITSNGQISIDAKDMCNLGELKSNQLLLNSSSQIDNHGEIAVQGKLHITGSGTTINHGRLSSTAGTIDTECEKFEQIQGELISGSVKLASKQSVINGIVRGQEIELQNAVTNNGTLDFQKGSIAGALRNNGQANFSKLLQLSGDRSTIDNHGTINNEELIAKLALFLADK